MTRCARREAGQVGTWPVLVVALLVLALGVTAYTRLSTAVQEEATIQLAADAAALAGAQSIGVDAPGRLVSALNSGQPLPCGLGRDAAADFAGRNGSSVVSYCYHPVSDRVEVTVRSARVTESGARETASATAKVGLRLGPCSFGTPPPPTPTPTPTPSPTSTPTTPVSPPPPPPDVETSGTCGDLDIDVTWPGSGGGPTFSWNAAMLRSMIDPRLTR